MIYSSKPEPVFHTDCVREWQQAVNCQDLTPLVFLLGSESFVDFIKEKYIYGKKPDREIPALKELSDRPSMVQISELVDTVSWKDAGLSRGIKIYLCRQYSGKKLKEIGAFFGIGESGVSQASRRIEEKMNSSRVLKNKMQKVKKRL